MSHRDAPGPCLPSFARSPLLLARASRRVNNDYPIDFEAQNYEISPLTRKFVTIIRHSNLKFLVVSKTL